MIVVKRLLLYLLGMSIPLTAHADPLGQPGLGYAILTALLVIVSSLFTIIYAFTFLMTRLNKAPFPAAKIFAWVMISLFSAVLVSILAVGGHANTSPDKEMGLVDVGLFLLFGGFVLALYSLKTNAAYNARIKEDDKKENEV